MINYENEYDEGNPTFLRFLDVYAIKEFVNNSNNYPL